MTTLTLNLSEETHERLLRLADQRKLSLDELIEDLANAAFAESGARARFLARAALGSAEAGYQILDTLEMERHHRPGDERHPVAPGEFSDGEDGQIRPVLGSNQD